MSEFKTYIKTNFEWEEITMDDLNKDPERAAKDVVEQARKQYSGKDYKEFRYRTMKEFEDAKPR